MDLLDYNSSLIFRISNLNTFNSPNFPINTNHSYLKNIIDGSIIIRFRNYPKQGFMPLLTFANNQYPSSYISFYIEHGQKIGVLKHIIYKNGIEIKHLNLHKTTVVDPKFINTVALSCKRNYGYSLYFNGDRGCFYPDKNACLFSDINKYGDIDKGIVGEFYESQKIPYKYYSFCGHYDFIHIHNKALSEDILKIITAQTKVLNSTNLQGNSFHQYIFFPGLNGSSNFRIPTLYKTSKGTIISSVDQREFGHQDHPNKIKTIVRRSTDNGKTFGPPITACKLFGRGQTIDSSIVEDKVNNRLFLLNNSYPDCLRPFNPKSGSGYIKNKDKYYYRLSYCDLEYFGDMSGKIYDNNWRITDFSFDNDFNLYYIGKRISNLFNSDSPIKIYQTTYTIICHSDDDGLTWSKPQIINHMIKENFMKSLNVSPGVGIQINSGSYNGRICFPVYYYNKYNAGSSAIIYSDDFGETFLLGKSPNCERKFLGNTLSSETISDEKEFLTECQIVEMPNGYLKLFMRNMNGYTAIATSRDGGETFDDNVLLDENLIDPYCQSSVIALSSKIDGKDSIAFCNPSSLGRADGTIKIGLLDYQENIDDYKITWKYSKLIKHGSFAYSCLAQINDNTIGIVYEGTPSTYISFAKLDIEFIKTPDKTHSIKYTKDISGNILTLSFSENVMLTGDRSIIISQKDKKIIAKFKERNIFENKYTFKLDGTISNESFELSLTGCSYLYNNLGINLDL